MQAYMSSTNFKFWMQYCQFWMQHISLHTKKLKLLQLSMLHAALLDADKLVPISGSKVF